MGHTWQGNEGDIIEITIRDFSGAKIESRKCNVGDKEEITRIIKWLKSKYDINVDWLSFDNDFLKI